MISPKLFKLIFHSYVKRIKKVNFNGKLTFLRHADNYSNSRFRNLCSYCNAIWELKPDKQRWERW